MSDLRTLQIGMSLVPAGGGLDRYYGGLLDALPAHGIAVHRVVGGVDGNLAPYAFPVLDVVRARPFAIHFHGPWAAESQSEGAGPLQVAVKRQLERIVYRRGARVIVLSQAFAGVAERTYGVPAEAIRVVPGGLDCARYAAKQTRLEARTALGLPADRPLVVTVRRLVRAKGIEQLIDATLKVRERTPDVLVAIAGRGPLGLQLASRVREAGLERNVVLLGFVDDDDLPALYRAADVAVVPTIAHEGFGLVVVEALASGTPVLVTPVAGLPEVVRALDPTMVLEDSGADSIARGIEAVLNGEHKLPDSQACVAYARQFDWSTIAGRVAGVYREIA
jgi:glycosyltransferase involved in cell wall biosynthesis